MSRWRIWAMLAVLWAAPSAGRASAFDEFQVFDGKIAEPGGLDLNQYVIFGRRGRAGDGAPRNGMLATTELGWATTRWHEIALYVPVAAEFSGDLFGGGLKLRNTFVLPDTASRPFGAGVDVELRRQSYRFAETDWSFTVRPILDFREGPWQLILNPAVEFAVGRGGAVFAPAVRGVRQVAGNTWVGLEHFMDFGPVARFETTARQAHQLFVTTDVKLSDKFALHVGVGHGLTRSSDRWAGKLILSVDF